MFKAPSNKSSNNDEVFPKMFLKDANFFERKISLKLIRARQSILEEQ